MAERELCDEQNEAAQATVQEQGRTVRGPITNAPWAGCAGPAAPSGLAGHVDPYHLQPWHREHYRQHQKKG